MVYVVEVVTKVKVRHPYSLEIEFSDGVVGELDLEDEIYGEVFEPLRDPETFASAAVDDELGTVVWPNGADFSPEFLYERAMCPTINCGIEVSTSKIGFCL